MDVSDLAEAALQKKAYAEAVVYYRTLAKAVPERAVSYRKVCSSYEAMGDWQNALQFCRTALTKEGAYVQDFANFARIMLRAKPTFSQQDAAELDAVAAHLRIESPKSGLADEIACDIGLKLQDGQRLKNCTERLATSAPDNVKTLTYQWAYALERGDTKAVRAIIDKAKRVGANAAVIGSLEEGLTKFNRRRQWLWLQSHWLLTGVLVMALFAGCAVVIARRHRPSMATG